MTTQTESQCKQILSHLQAGNTISPIGALERFGCFRLSARIYDLREQGHDISMEVVPKNGKRFARYKLAGV